jgi:hypothetical protein
LYARIAGKKLCRADIEQEITLYLWCKKCKKEVAVKVGKESQNEPNERN